MCFYLLPVTDSDLKFVLVAKQWALRFHYIFAVLLGFFFHIFPDIEMASGSAQAGERGVRIRPLLPDTEVPRGRSQDWLTVYNSKFSNRVHRVITLQYDTWIILVKPWECSITHYQCLIIVQITIEILCVLGHLARETGWVTLSLMYIAWSGEHTVFFGIHQCTGIASCCLSGV